MTVSTDVLESAAALLRERWPRRPQAGLVLGSGLGCLVDAVDVEAVIDACEIPGLPVSTAIGHRGRFVCGLLSGVPVIVQDGRLHSYEGHDFSTCAWPVRLMARLGIETLVVTNASGGVNPDYSPGDVMLIEDHINLMWGNPLIGPNDDRVGPRFPDMSAPYDRELAKRLSEAAHQMDLKIHRGVYLALAGPNYETSAEYRMVRKLGADVVGMSTVPEVLTARHAGVRVLGLSIVANVFQEVTEDGAVAPDETTGDAVVAQVAETAPRVGRLLQLVISSERRGAGQGGGHLTEPVDRPSVQALEQTRRSTSNEVPATAALLTAGGRGAVAVIRVVCRSDSKLAVIDRFFRSANGRSIEQQDLEALCYGVWCDADALGMPGVAAEDVVLCRTDSSSVEIHCHGGPAAVERILNQLEQAEVCRVGWGEQLRDECVEDAASEVPLPADSLVRSSVQIPTRPHCSSGQLRPVAGIDLECFDALTRASTERSALIVLRQAQGILRTEIDALIDLSVRIGIEKTQGPTEGKPVVVEQAEFSTRLQSLLDRAEFGIHLVEPWRVVLAGRPNAGKSTLLNALLGYSRAIVFDEPGTTRDVVTGATAFDGWPFLLSDTAGMRETGSELEREGIRRTQQSMNEADLVCLLLDTSVPPTEEDRRLISGIREAVSPRKLLVIAHKSDRPDVWKDELPAEALPVSSVTRDGVDRLVAEIVKRVVARVPESNHAIPVTRRQVGHLRQAFESALQDDWPDVRWELILCRESYRPDEVQP